MHQALPLKALFVDVAPARVTALSKTLTAAGWAVTARRVTGADDVAAALLDRGWDAVIYGGERDPQGVPARKALALARLADPHLPFLAVSAGVRPDDIATVVQGVEGIVFADADTLAERLAAELDRAAHRREIGVNHRLLHAQRAVADLLAAGLAPAELIERVLEALAESLGWEFAAAWQPDADPAWLRPVATWQSAAAPPELVAFAALTREARFAPGRGLPGRVWAFRRPLWMPDVREGSTTRRAVHAARAQLGCAAAFPVVVGDSCLAVIELWGRGRRESEPDVAALLATVGGQLGQAFAREQRDASALAAERTRWREYMRLTGALVVELDHEGRVVHASSAVVQLLGAEEHELARRDWFATAIPEHEREGARRTHADVLRRGTVREEQSGLVTLDGELRTIAWRHAALHDAAGAPTGTLSTGEDMTGRRRTEQQITYLAYHDALTGLPNRGLLEEHLKLTLARSRRTGAGVAVMHLDLDGFKVVNDSLGHTAGDELLCRLAARMRGALRATDLLARTNGDEFLVLLADIQQDPREIATSVAAKLVRALAVPFEVSGAEFQVGASIGISTAPADASEPGALLAHADAALRRAKTGSRGGWALFARSEHDPMRRLELSAGMRQALTEGQLSLQYQPIHALPDGRLTGLEALLRWHHPDRGWIAPSEFIPVAEETGLIESIGDWVARGVCEQQAAWASRGLLPTISFNVAPRELRRTDFARRMAEHLRATGADPQRIIVELTESTTIQDPAAAEPNLQRLHDLGLALALDDFGTGYSSLARLRSLPIATLKIDRAFLRDVPDDPQAAALLTAVLQIARALGRSTVAEGVETEAQRTFLEREGCEYAQGFLFAPPMPADEVEPLLAAAPALAAR